MSSIGAVVSSQRVIVDSFSKSVAVVNAGPPGPPGPPGAPGPQGPQGDPGIGATPIASTAEVFAGVETNKSVSPAGLRSVSTFTDVRWFGAVGDGVTDCLSAFNQALTHASQNSGVVLITKGIYLISNTWVIRKSNVKIIIDPSATVKMTAASTYGGTIAIAEGTAYGGSDAAQLENVWIGGGGWVTSVGDLENAIGVVRAKNVVVEGLNVSAGRFGITFQVNVDNSAIIRNIVWLAHAAAIDISDTALTMHDNRIEGNIVISSTVSGVLAGEGIRCTGFDGLIVRDNVIMASDGRGIRIYGTVSVTAYNLICSGNRVLSTGSYAGDFQYVTRVNGDFGQFIGGLVNLAFLIDVDISLSISNSDIGSSLTLNTLSGKSKIKALITGQTAVTGALSVTAPPIGHEWEIHVGPGSHNRICANAVSLKLNGTAEGGSIEPFGTGCVLLPSSNLAVDGGRIRQSVAYAASITPVFWTTKTCAVTLTGNLTIQNMGTVTPAKIPGHRITFQFTQDAVGFRKVSWGSSYITEGLIVNVLPNAVTTVVFESDGVNWVYISNPNGSTSTFRTILAADVVNNNAVANTLQDVTGLSFPVLANTRYYLRAFIVYSSAAATTGSRWVLNGPTLSELAYRVESPLSATSLSFSAGNTAYGQPAASSASSVVSGNIVELTGLIKCTENGLVVVQFASEVASSAITAKAGSFIEYSILG